jgi:hypothetical protein
MSKPIVATSIGALFRLAVSYIASISPALRERGRLPHQWPAAGRIAERDAVHLAGSGPGRIRTLAGRLQRCATSLAARMEDTIGVRRHLQSATGSGAALWRGQDYPSLNSLKKSLPLSSMTMKAGKSTTSIRQIASMPSSGYSTTSTFLMQCSARFAAAPPIDPR